jgi:hypothetical protein
MCLRRPRTSARRSALRGLTLLQVFESQFQLLDLPLQFVRLPPEADLNGERPATGAYRAALMLNS